MSAVTESAWENPVCTGGPSPKPVMLTTPLRASPTFPKPGSLRAEVSAPLPVICSMTTRGLIACRTSQSSRQRASVLTRTLVMTTSAHRTRSCANACPSSCRKSIVTDRLLRPETFHHKWAPSLLGPMVRPGSPAPGSSTWTTSAPRSAMSVPARGPAITWANSTTLIPASAGCFISLAGTTAPPFTYFTDPSAVPNYDNYSNI